MRVELTVVEDEAERAVRFGGEEDRCAVRGCRRADEPLGKEVVELLLELLNLVGRESRVLTTRWDRMLLLHDAAVDRLALAVLPCGWLRVVFGHKRGHAVEEAFDERKDAVGEVACAGLVGLEDIGKGLRLQRCFGGDVLDGRDGD